ncbi:MAG TPA: PEP-CTERM sorting domain-containing protein [Candidatus Acidoferrum sp.]|nr:PEP-CTERM sorting domain-containing protein [Candidatus Acidoferrum sp.]
MKFRLLALVSLIACLPVTGRAQLFISEFFANPSGGTDSPLEWVELIATEDINFSVTPFSVVFADNGSTRFGTNGWTTGGNVTYGFDIIAGTVARGDVVYVGGSGMAPNGIRLRTIDTGTTAGDGFGTAATGGVLGNGGGVSDGLAVFNTAIGNVTSSLQPVDAIFFGNNPTGAVFLTAYQLPQNDVYSGGTMSVTSFIGPDPGGGETIIASGVFNADTRTWEAARQWSVGALSDGASSVLLTPVPEPSTIALLILGCVTSGIRMWRQRK